MTKFLIGAVVAAAAAIGSAGVANASPVSPVHVPVNAHGRGGVSIGVGFGGGGYYGGHAQPVQSGYWTTQYRYVPTTVFVGYDQWQRPVYQTQYVQQAYQVWVPTVTYAPVVHRRPSVHVGFGYRWR
jgi:hypothetical protein